MSSKPDSTTSGVTVRLPINLLRQLDELCVLTGRTRSYWITTALEALIADELEDAQSVASDQPEPGDLPGDQMASYMIAHGLSSPDALERAGERSRRT